MNSSMLTRGYEKITIREVPVDNFLLDKFDMPCYNIGMFKEEVEMYSVKMYKCSRECSCGNDKIALEFSHEDETWLMFCWVCATMTEPVDNEQEAVKMWEEGNVSGFTGAKSR